MLSFRVWVAANQQEASSLSGDLWIVGYLCSSEKCGGKLNGNLASVPFNNVENVTALPFTPTHNGMFEFMITRGVAQAETLIIRVVKITDNTANKDYLFNFASNTEYAGQTYFIPVLKNHQYSVTEGSTYVYLANGNGKLYYYN